MPALDPVFSDQSGVQRPVRTRDVGHQPRGMGCGAELQVAQRQSLGHGPFGAQVPGDRNLPELSAGGHAAGLSGGTFVEGYSEIIFGGGIIFEDWQQKAAVGSRGALAHLSRKDRAEDFNAVIDVVLCGGAALVVLDCAIPDRQGLALLSAVLSAFFI